MKSHTLVAALAPIVLAAAGAVSAQATTLQRLTLTQLARAANAVIYARCVSSESRWDSGAIWTFTTFDVLESFKGSAPPRITVRLPGGHVGHIVSTIEGAPRFRPEEQSFLFLETTRLGDYSVTAWGEGTFRVSAGTLGGTATVTRDSSAFPVFDTSTRRFRTEGVRRTPVGQFRELLGSALAAASEAKP